MKIADVLVERSYALNGRTSLLLNDINGVVKKKRGAMDVYTDIDKLPENCKVCIVISSSMNWTISKIHELNVKGIHPLLFGFNYLEAVYPYSCVCQAYTKTMYLLTKTLLEKDSGRIAFLGYNGDSLPDFLKLNGFKSAVEEFGAEHEIFKNRGNIDECIEKFALRKKEFKNIVCCNDSIAIALQSKLKEPGAFNVSGFGGMKITEFSPYPFLTARIDYLKMGKILAEQYFYLSEKSEINPMTVEVESDIYCGAEIMPEMKLSNGFGKSRHEKSIDFYEDASVKEIENIENMLLECDDIDIMILKDVCEKVSYEAIAEKYFMALNTVKYRIKKLKAACRASEKKEIVRLIEKYRLKLS